MTHKETTVWLRTCIKRYGIKARVCMQTYCGSKVVSVVAPSYESVFTSEQIRNICMAAKSNGLTFVQGIEIDPEHESTLTGKQQWNFYL